MFILNSKKIYIMCFLLMCYYSEFNFSFFLFKTEEKGIYFWNCVSRFSPADGDAHPLY